MKTTFILMLVGALLGITAASFIVPPTLAWYAAPGGLPQGAAVPSMVQVPEVIRYATTTLIRWQAIAAVTGAVGGLAIGIMTRRRQTMTPATTGHETTKLETTKKL